jgi:hypothetical protein
MLRWDSKKSIETDDYDLDWSLRLGTGDSIVNSTWTLPGVTSLTIVSNTFTSTATKVFLSGGRDRQTYVLQNQINTLLGDILYEFVSIDVKDK